jgi:glycosyltransferase involved in cell wall biosynthesis
VRLISFDFSWTVRTLCEVKVAFDYQIFTLQRRGGVSRYFVELYKALMANGGCEPKFFTPLHFNSHLRESVNGSGLYLPYSTDILGFNKSVRSINLLACKFKMKKFKPAILHETFYEDTSHYSYNYPKITTVHDLTRERLRADKHKIAKKKNAIHRSERIITVSDSTTADLIEFYGVSPSIVSTIHVGVSDFFRSEPPSIRIRNSQKPYILFVGHREGYKNWKTLIFAFSKSTFLRNNFDVHCFGGDEFTPSEKQLLRDLSIQSNVRWSSGNDLDLLFKYQNAACLVYPSLYEGFGSPIIEAMASGCPVFASRISALLESGGQAAKFFNPRSEESIIDVLESGLNSVSNLSQMIQLGRTHSSQFTWDKTAAKTLRVYQSIAETK